MLKKWKKRYWKWKIWKNYCSGSEPYKVLVLLGLRHSPWFDIFQY